MYLLCYDLKSGLVNVSLLFSEIEKLGDAVQILDTAWVIQSSLSHEEIYSRLKRIVQTDRFAVFETYDRNRQGWLAKDMWSWMRSKDRHIAYNFHLAYDKKDRQTEDSEQMLKIVLAVLKDKIGVGLGNLCRPSESTLLFHSDMVEKDVFDVFAQCLSDKLYYSLSRIVPTSKTDGFIMQPKNSLTETLTKAWDALDTKA